MNLRDRVIVITGASSGFGELTARMCAKAGARLVLVARSADKLEQLAGNLGGPDRVLVVPTDITDQEAVTHMAAQVISHYGRVDVLVNNAGYGFFDPVEKLPLDAVAGMLDVNVLGALRCTQAFLPHMRAQRTGQIVVVASIAGLLPFRNMGGYAASKFALVGLFQTLQLELAGSGIRCAIICPGPSLTSFMQSPNADIHKFPRITRMLPWLKPEQVAAEVVRAIARRVHGRVIIPRITIPLVIFGQALPGLARLIMRLVG
ncbi:MAG: SDR family NAD(P)-dependent oxidoreductase [Roseiflexaceae bacterium]|nr:SDR family NAD(P)-dependent oxidoreductase [Roseiflexaceae bacterium]